MKSLKFISTALVLLISFSCKTPFLSQIEVSQTSITPELEIDSSMYFFVEKYKVDLDAQMNQILSHTSEDLIKAQPASNLGNMMADVMYDYYAKQNQAVDIAISNQGGIRVPSISKGSLTMRDAYELMPFDNQIVMLEIPGSVLQELIQHISNFGGWPISQAEVTINSEREVQSIYIQGEPLDINRIYRLATHDYIASGGDQCSFLTDYEMIRSEKLLRDAIIEYWKSFPTSIPIDNQKRIRYEDE